ncbi:hypothetical protein [Atribacter sp.]|uniref:hypothetical protein n=1 Tax=Atribacter sp. TaxID=2847780 RepID=UPI002D1FA74B|nr:hypothetical protein [Atribacter sp.]
MRFSRRPVEDTGLLRMTKWMVEIATSFNQKSVDLIAMTDLDRYFHPHLMLPGSMMMYSLIPFISLIYQYCFSYKTGLE